MTIILYSKRSIENVYIIDIVYTFSGSGNNNMYNHEDDLNLYINHLA